MSAALAAALAVLAVGALRLLVMLRRNRALRRRPGNVCTSMRQPDGERWLAGHGVWVDDVFAFRRSPAGWSENLLWVANASARAATEEERTRMRRLGEEPVVVTFALASGGSAAFAVAAENRAALLGPFA